MDRGSHFSHSTRMLVLSADEALRHGLSCLGRPNNKRFKPSPLNRKRFKKLYGVNEVVLVQLWTYLQLTNVLEAKVSDAKQKHFTYFLMTLYHMKNYPVLEVLGKTFGACEDTASFWIRHFMKKIAALKETRIVWPEDFGPTRFILSVDCVNFGINEPRHAIFHKMKEYFDRKGGKAGLTYEVALDLWESNIIWLNGPFPAATGDSKIFKEEGLMDHIPEGKKGIADKIYEGQPKIAPHNSLDNDDVRDFKARGRARMESVFTRFKSFGCLKQRFRHGMLNHEMYVHAVAVIITFQFECGSPLFDI